MSSPEEKLVARLKAIASVTAVVGTQIWPIKQTQGTTGNCIVYNRSASRPVNSAGGATATAEVRFQLRLMCVDYPTAKALANAVRGNPEAVGGPTGLSGWTDADGCVWHKTAERDDPGPIKPAQDEPEDWGVLQEYSVWCTE
jgi:hypothetical protein